MRRIVENQAIRFDSIRSGRREFRGDLTRLLESWSDVLLKARLNEAGT
ncbi:MAG: hypothetical protein ACFFDI_05120 [Promethearchaeota archaeon]